MDPVASSYDCLIVGAGPGGLQAAIYLCRYGRDVLIVDRGGGRTRHARRIENFMTHSMISGQDLIEKGLAQAARFGARTEKKTVTSIERSGHEGPFGFLARTAGGGLYKSRSVIVSSGAQDILPRIENLARYFAWSFFTRVDCDGYRTRGKKTAILGDSESTLRLALAVKQMYTKDVAVVLDGYTPPPGYMEEMQQEGIEIIYDSPAVLHGDDTLRSMELKSGRRILCDAVLSNYGYKLNDSFLGGLGLKKDPAGKYQTNRHFESSLPGLYIVGHLAGSDQAIIAAGEGAMAAMDLNKRLIEMHSE
ncbi:MAG: NAD(P)/FAD-dependent oxidoreductase [Nitrospiraceae bacterium]|nr:NAD(P)/FAD-dependent oxidoreductase [Nitrospiraceae bacterium]